MYLRQHIFVNTPQFFFQITEGGFLENKNILLKKQELLSQKHNFTLLLE